MRYSLGMGEKIETAEVANLGPGSDDRKALSPTDRNIETIGVEQEFGAARGFRAKAAAVSGDLPANYTARRRE
jgi:hypothetical protein